MYKNKYISAIITAAGSGLRMGYDIPKLEIEINDKAIINYTVEKLSGLDIFDEIILVTSPELLEVYEKRFSYLSRLKVVEGGKSREESTLKGLNSLDKKSQIVVCHDGARPFVSRDTILKSIDSALVRGSGIAAVKVKDTIKLVDNNIVHITPNRDKLYNVQTPQTFKTDLIKKAYNEFYGKIEAKDDSYFLEIMDGEVYIVDGSYDNIKITTKEDLIFAKMLLEEK